MVYVLKINAIFTSLICIICVVWIPFILSMLQRLAKPYFSCDFWHIEFVFSQVFLSQITKPFSYVMKLHSFCGCSIQTILTWFVFFCNWLSNLTLSTSWVTLHYECILKETVLYRVVQNKVDTFYKKPHFSQVWQYNVFIWKYLQTVICREDMVKVASKYWNTEMGVLFGQIVKNHFTHT